MLHTRDGFPKSLLERSCQLSELKCSGYKNKTFLLKNMPKGIEKQGEKILLSQTSLYYLAILFPDFINKQTNKQTNKPKPKRKKLIFFKIIENNFMYSYSSLISVYIKVLTMTTSAASTCKFPWTYGKHKTLVFVSVRAYQGRSLPLLLLFLPCLTSSNISHGFFFEKIRSPGNTSDMEGPCAWPWTVALLLWPPQS